MSDAVRSGSLSDALRGGFPALLTDSAWPPAEAARWTPRHISASIASHLDPVRVGRSGEAFWNPDRTLLSDSFAYVGAAHREVRMETSRFWTPPAGTVHYYSGSVQDDDGAPHADLRLPAGLVEQVSEGSSRDETAASASDHNAAVSAKIWLGTSNATTPLHYDSQHNLYAQVWHALALEPASHLCPSPYTLPLTNMMRLT